MTKVNEGAKKKMSARKLARMVIEEAINILVGPYLGQFRAMQVKDFLFRE
ncbi:MAG: hypothetical protein WC460_02790 [Patescibacteria group bacterium]